MVFDKLQEVALAKVKGTQSQQGYSDQGWPLQLSCIVDSESSMLFNMSWRTTLDAALHEQVKRM